MLGRLLSSYALLITSLAACGKHQVISPVARPPSSSEQSLVTVDERLLAASAVKQGDGQTLAHLVASKRLDLNALIPGEGGKTLMMLAVLWDQPHLVEYLQGQKVDLSLVDELGKSVWDYAQSSPLMAGTLNGETLSPELLGQVLIEGIQRDQGTKIAFALGHGADLNQKNQDGVPFLFLPLQMLNSDNESQKLLTFQQLLAAAEVDPNITDGKKMTVGMWAIIQKNLNFFRLWHQHGKSDVNLANNRGETCLLLAFIHGLREVIDDLLADQETNFTVGTKNETVLQIMFSSKNLSGPAKMEIFDFFTKLPAFDFNQVDRKKEGIIFWPFGQRTDFSRALLRRLLEIPQININLQNYQGNTPLHLAISLNLEREYTLLLQRADLNWDLKNHAHQRPRDLAQMSLNPFFREFIKFQ